MQVCIGKLELYCDVIIYFLCYCVYEAAFHSDQISKSLLP